MSFVKIGYPGCGMTATELLCEGQTEFFFKQQQGHLNERPLFVERHSSTRMMEKSKRPIVRRQMCFMFFFQSVQIQPTREITITKLFHLYLEWSCWWIDHPMCLIVSLRKCMSHWKSVFLIFQNTPILMHSSLRRASALHPVQI